MPRGPSGVEDAASRLEPEPQWTAEPPEVVRTAHQLHEWQHLSFLHWPFPPAVVAEHLPAGLTVDTFGGAAWVGLIPFRLRIRVPGVPYLPWVGAFVETNVRTYVRGPDGTPGIWFLSLDAARFGAVVGARTSWSLPYMWARMRLTRRDDLIVYECRRRWPGPATATSRVALRVGPAYEPGELGDLDHFLTARWTLFSTMRGALAQAQAGHPAWPLRHATVVELDDHLLTAAGLPQPSGPPLVHHSDGVAVRLGGRHCVSRSS
jgi:uncharacterized protein